MSMVLTRDEVKELLPAYALGSLDADERVGVEQSLARYPDLAAELAGYDEVTSSLATAVLQRIPPPALKLAVLAAAHKQPEPSKPQPTWWERLLDILRTGGLAPRLAFATLALGLVLGIGYLAFQLPSTVAQLVEQQQVKDLMAQGTDAVHLKGTTSYPKAWALIKYKKGEQVAGMWVGDLAPLARAQTYQLWMVDNTGKRWDGGVFNTSGKGERYVIVHCPLPVDSMVRFGVSVEPAAGSATPTGPGVMRWDRANSAGTSS